MAFLQGKYTLNHPEKYVGDVNKVIYRSSWELHAHKFLDNNPNVIEWGSEVVVIPYVKPTDKKVHKYFIDLYVKYKNRSGEIVRELIEIKPKKQTRASRSRNRKHKLYEDITYAINSAKWQAAKQFADKNGFKFTILTEDQLFR